MTNQGYDGLLLDHDGVIVTLCSRRVLRDAASEAFADAGVSNPKPDDVDSITINVSAEELCSVADRYGVDPDRLWQCRENRIETTLRRETRAGRKAPYDDVACLGNVEVPTGVVSNNQTRIIEYVLEAYKLRECVETIRAREPTRESLREKKPEPTYLRAAATDLGCSNPLYVGDSESDVVAGHRAGFDTVFLRREHNAELRLEAEPTVEVGSLETVVEMI